MKNGMSTLIVVKPGRMRDSLRALLRAIPGVSIIGQVDNSSSALEMIVNHQPALTLLATNLPGDEIWHVLKQIKGKQLQTRCLVLAGTLQQQWLAKNAGADSVLLAGFPAAKFYETIEELRAEQKVSP